MIQDRDDFGLLAHAQKVALHLEGLHQELHQVQAQLDSQRVGPAGFLVGQGKVVAGLCLQLLPVCPRQKMIRLQRGEKEWRESQPVWSSG